MHSHSDLNYASIKVGDNFDELLDGIAILDELN